jgi:hypothetical protein
MFSRKEKIEKLVEENKSLRIKAIAAGVLALIQIQLLFLERFQENGFIFAGVLGMIFGVMVGVVSNGLLIKNNNDLIKFYKSI